MRTLKYYPRLKVYKTPSRSIVIDNDFNQGTLYDWYVVLKRFSGILYLNTYNMSDTTKKYVDAIRRLLISQKVDFVEVEYIKSLNSIGEHP